MLHNKPDNDKACSIYSFIVKSLIDMNLSKRTIKRDPVLALFCNRLLARLGTDLKELWLFGSRARGDNQEDSDYDVLVVTAGPEADRRVVVLDEGFSILEERQKWIGLVVYSPEHWKLNHDSILGRNIIKDGIRLL